MKQLQTDITESTQRLQDYLTQEDFLGEGEILLVDIGWNGSILSTLEKTFGDLPTFPQIDASFFGRLYGEHLDKIHLAPGFAYDANRPNPIEHLINECRELFETSASSLAGSVLGYSTTANIIQPRYAESTLDDADKTLISQIQQGILAYCDDFAQIYNRFTPVPEALRYDALVQATSLIAGTNSGEQKVIENLKVDLSLGTEGRVSLREYLGFNSHDTSTAPVPTHSASAIKVNLFGSDTKTHNLQKVLEKVHQMVEQLRQEDQLVFYGTGTVASLIAPLLIDKIAYFVDGNSALHGQRFLGLPIHPPEVLDAETSHTVFITPVGRKNVISNRLIGSTLRIYYIEDFL